MAWQPQQNLSATVTAIQIPGVAHGAVLNPTVYPQNPPALMQAIQAVQDLIGSWLADFQAQHQNARRTSDEL